MAKLLELRERLRSLYGRFEIYVKPAIRFVAAIITFLLINGTIGYMSKLKSPAIAIALALVCTFLPVNATVVLAAALVLVHLLALSLEACVVALLLFLLMFFMYYKYAPKNGYSAVLTPVLCQLRIPHAVPTAIGLYKEPYSVISMVCGIVTYYFLKGIRENDVLLSAEEDDAMLARFRLVLQQIVNNKEMYITIVAFSLTAILIYVIRKQSFAHAWTIAIAVGNVVNLLVLLIGSFLMGTMENVLWQLAGTVVAVVVGLIMECFLFHLDYARIEQVQFEDDEYYYYVKAVPKVFMSTQEKQVKQINSRKSSGISKKELADEFDIDQELLNELTDKK